MSEISKYQPLSNFVLVKRIENELDEIRGIVLPDISKTQSNKGRVVAVGDGQGINVEPGDVVLFAKYGAEEVTLDGEEFLLLRYDEIKLKERLVVG